LGWVSLVDLDVDVDFLAKLDGVGTVGKLEEAAIKTWFGWASDLLSEGELLFWLDWNGVNLHTCDESVSVDLNKLDISWPFSLTSILESPFQSEYLQSLSFHKLLLSWMSD